MCRVGQRKLGTELAPYSFYPNNYIKTELFNSGVGYKKLYNVIRQDYKLSGSRRIVVCGGDHSVSAGSIPAISDIVRQNNKSLSIIWIDAHADINTFDSSVSQNTHGMVVAMLVGLCANPWIKTHNLICPRKITYVGLRDVDEPEIQYIKQLGIEYYTSKNVLDYGIDYVIERIRKKVGDDVVHISLDVDAVDPQYIPSTGTPVSDGLKVLDCEKIIGCMDKNKLRSMDLVEFNPLIGSRDDVKKSIQNIRRLIDKFYQ